MQTQDTTLTENEFKAVMCTLENYGHIDGSTPGRELDRARELITKVKQSHLGLSTEDLYFLFAAVRQFLEKTQTIFDETHDCCVLEHNAAATVVGVRIANLLGI